ncbi:MAG: hypothetical protein ACLFP8_05815 [Alphaproteobacteria bacterium]
MVSLDSDFVGVGGANSFLLRMNAGHALALEGLMERYRVIEERDPDATILLDQATEEGQSDHVLASSDVKKELDRLKQMLDGCSGSVAERSRRWDELSVALNPQYGVGMTLRAFEEKYGIGDSAPQAEGPEALVL